MTLHDFQRKIIFRFPGNIAYFPAVGIWGSAKKVNFFMCLKRRSEVNPPPPVIEQNFSKTHLKSTDIPEKGKIFLKQRAFGARSPTFWGLRPQKVGVPPTHPRELSTAKLPVVENPYIHVFT